MSGPAYVLPTISSRKLGAVFANESATGSNSKGKEREGSLAATLTPSTLDFGGKIKLIDVVKDYTWTLSQLTPDDIEEVPYIQLQEFKVVDGSIKRQFQFYANSYLPDAASDAVPIFLKRPSDSNTSVLDAYKDIWPTDDPTGFSYKFPYFNKVGYELGTEQWQDIQPIGDSVKQLAGGFGETAGKLVGNVIDLAANVSNGIMNYQYPAVGVTDRPRTFVGHNDRTITISFTLYNTLRDVDWKDNRDLVYMLMSQNLFNKRDSTTGVPPVFYSVHIPGQYFCYAACATNYKVEYLGASGTIYCFESYCNNL